MTAPKYDGFVPGKHPVDAYGAMGFRFANMSHQGSILCLPSGIYRWDAQTAADIKTSTMAAVFAETAPIDLLLVGTGLELVPLPEALRWRLRDKGISGDPMPTGAAARTYNILLNENRRVAAALIAVP
jgi:uncharacterized protein